MLTVHEDLEQRSPEWYDQRRGIVTASVVSGLVNVGSPDPQTVACRVCQANPGDPCISMASKTSKPIRTTHSQRAYAAAEMPPTYGVANDETSRGLTTLLVAERITGHTHPNRIADDMWRGILHEPIARDVYSKNYEAATECGFMVRQEKGWTLGYSPDGLVGEDGLIEIKCPRAKAHLATILADEVPAAYMAQLQAGLLVSERAWIDYVSFYGGMPLYRKRVFPDLGWHDAIVRAVSAFEQRADEQINAYVLAIEGLPTTERVPEYEDVELKLA